MDIEENKLQPADASEAGPEQTRYLVPAGIQSTLVDGFGIHNEGDLRFITMYKRDPNSIESDEQGSQKSDSYAIARYVMTDTTYRKLMAALTTHEVNISKENK